MGIQFVGWAGGVGRNVEVTIPLSSGLTGGIDTAVKAGDFVIGAVSMTGAADYDMSNYIYDPSSANYTLIGSELYANDDYDVNGRAGYKRMGATPDASVKFAAAGASSRATACIAYVFRGVHAVTPIDVTTTTATGINTVLANPPAITPITPGAKIVVIGFGAVNDNSAEDGAQFTNSETVYFASKSRGPTTGYDSIVGVGHYNWTSGAFDPAAFAYENTDAVTDSWGALTIALRPTPGGIHSPSGGVAYGGHIY